MELKNGLHENDIQKLTSRKNTNQRSRDKKDEEKAFTSTCAPEKKKVLFLDLSDVIIQTRNRVGTEVAKYKHNI